MKYVEFTYVDRFTRISIFEKPAMNGPILPPGVDFKFALESKYPTTKPVFYGTCEDDFDFSQSGVIRELSQAEFNEAQLLEFNNRKQIKLTQLTQAWENKLHSGFEYQNITFDSSEKSMVLISNAAQAAIASKVMGKEFTPITWYGINNESITFDVDGLIDFHTQMVSYGETIFAKFLEIESAIKSVNDLDFSGLMSVAINFNV